MTRFVKPRCCSPEAKLRLLLPLPLLRFRLHCSLLIIEQLTAVPRSRVQVRALKFARNVVDVAVAGSIHTRAQHRKSHKIAYKRTLARARAPVVPRDPYFYTLRVVNGTCVI